MMKVIIKGPILSRSGYGEHARLVFRALRSRPDKFDVYILPLEWGLSNWPVDVNDPETEDIFMCMNKMAHSDGQFDLSMQVTIPTEWQNMATCNIGVTAGIETDKASPEWIHATNIVDRIIVVSNHAKVGLAGSKYQHETESGEIEWLKCDKEIDVIGYPVKDYSNTQLDLKLDTEFNFLTVGQISPRKNVGDLVKWFVSEFKDDDVGLVVKLHTNNNSHIDYEQTLRKVKSWTSDKDKKCKVYLIHGNLSDDELHSLYTHPKIKAFVSTTHGEGYGLPLFEAAYSGMPIAAPGWSGHMDFLCINKNKSNGKVSRQTMFEKIGYDIAPIQEEAVWENVLEKDSQWCYPKEHKSKSTMRKLYENHKAKKNTAMALKDSLFETHSEDIIQKQVVDAVLKVSPDTSKEWQSDINQVGTL